MRPTDAAVDRLTRLAGETSRAVAAFPALTEVLGLFLIQRNHVDFFSNVERMLRLTSNLVGASTPGDRVRK